MKIEKKLLLSPEDFVPSFENTIIEGIFNPGAIRDINGDIVLIVRIAESIRGLDKNSYPLAVNSKNYKLKIEEIDREEIQEIIGNMIKMKDSNYRLSNISHLRKVRLSNDGSKILEISRKPDFYPKEDYEECGVEDPRIVKIEDKYVMTYVSVSIMDGISSSIAVSDDLKTWKRIGVSFVEENKDVVLFPEKINDRYVAIHRPVSNFSFKNPSMWVSHSKDLRFWGEAKAIVFPRKNSWDSQRIGAGCPPIKTDKGWLLVYHGVRNNVYSAGAILLDIKDPTKILMRTPIEKPMFSPDDSFERQGFVNNVVFPTGIVLDDDEKHLLIYSGAADKYISLMKVQIDEVLKSLEKVHS